MIKKADIILFIVIVVVGLALSIWSLSVNDSGTDVKVTVNGKLYGTYSIAEDQTVVVRQDSHSNKIIIKDGKVSMAFSDCHNQDCVLHSPISQTNESITCLPNRVMVTVESEEGGGYDVISN